MGKDCSRGGFFAVWESVGYTLDIEDDGHTGKCPSEWWVLGLELASEHVALATGLVEVHRAQIDALLFFALHKLDRLAVNNGHDRELLLGLGLFDGARGIPPSAFNLEAEDVGTITVLLLGELCNLPVPSLLDLCLDVELVELNGISPGGDLLDGSQEGLRVVQPVDEGDVWLLSRVLLPGVELLETLLDVV